MDSDTTDRLSDQEDDALSELSDDSDGCIAAQHHEVRRLLEQRENRPVVVSTIHRVSNDMKFQYGKMFMNALNSGDFFRIQSFLKSFLTPTCSFQSICHSDPAMGIPANIMGVSPKAFAHYMIGVFVMCPDFVNTMLDARVVPSPNSAGTKIVMKMKSCGTKVSDLGLEDWIPVASSPANKRKHHHDEENLPDGSKPSEETPPFSDDSASPVSPTETTQEDARSTFKSPVQLSAGMDGVLSGDNCDQGKADDSFIPEAFVESLARKAIPRPSMPYLTFEGFTVLYLNESNNVQHIQCYLK